MTDTLLVHALQSLARVPSAVPLGADTLIAPDDPVLVEYVQSHLRPMLASAASEVIDLPSNQVAVRFGNGAGPCLALMAYTPTQHHNLMTDPWSGRLAAAPGSDEPAVYGQGVTQNKAHQACLVALSHWLSNQPYEIDGTLWLCINNEGRSTHDCSTAILDNLPGPAPQLLVQLFPTAFTLSVGNRGRTDLNVHIRGRATHSSSPPSSGRVIDAASNVLSAVQQLNEKVSKRHHPVLGYEQAVVYQLSFDPVAPHTLPSEAKVVVDRRCVWPESIASAGSELESALADVDPLGCEISVEPGVTMLPALLPDSEMVKLRPVEDAIDTVMGTRPERVVYGGTFDAGGPLARGIPTVMFGVPDTDDFLGDDYVNVADLQTQYRVLQQTIQGFFGQGPRREASS